MRWPSFLRLRRGYWQRACADREWENMRLRNRIEFMEHELRVAYRTNCDLATRVAVLQAREDARVKAREERGRLFDFTDATAKPSRTSSARS